MRFACGTIRAFMAPISSSIRPRLLAHVREHPVHHVWQVALHVDGVLPSSLQGKVVAAEDTRAGDEARPRASGRSSRSRRQRDRDGEFDPQL
jgi:hypothetical protein